MPDYFLALKLILTLNNDAVDHILTGQERFVMDLSGAEAAALSEQLEELGIAWRLLLERRQWREENKQAGLKL